MELPLLMLYMKVVKSVNSEFSTLEKQLVFSSVLYLYDMMDVHYTYSSNHFMMYESQIIMLLYTFNLYKMTKNVDSQAL